MPPGRPDAGDSQKTSKVSTKPSRNGAVRALGKTVRLRDKEHRKFVSRQACLVCGRTPSDLHHLTFMQPRALAHRVSDEFTVPVCRIHHRELHREGDEVAWWGKFSIDPLPVALRLWQHTRLNGNELAPSENITPVAGCAEPGHVSSRSSWYERRSACRCGERRSQGRHKNVIFRIFTPDELYRVGIDSAIDENAGRRWRLVSLPCHYSPP
jgi:hypothetical protein